MATTEAAAIAPPRRCNQLATLKSLLSNHGILSDHRDSTKANADLDLTSNTDEHLIGCLGFRRRVASLTVFKIVRHTAITAPAALMVNRYVPHQQDYAVSSTMGAGQSLRLPSMLARVLQNASLNSIPAEAESSELQPNLLMQWLLDPPPEVFLGACAIYGYGLLSFIQHPRRHRLSNSILLFSGFCGLTLGIALLQEGELLARVFTKYMPLTVLVGQVLILGLEAWDRQYSPQGLPFDAKLELQECCSKAADMFEDAEIDMSP